MELFQKIYIKSKSDLPKTNGSYDTSQGVVIISNCSSSEWKKEWLKYIKWYFLPVTVEELQEEICIYPRIKRN